MKGHTSLLIGCGDRGVAHATALGESDHFELRAICDHDLEQANALAEQCGVEHVYGDHQEALAATEAEHVTTVTAPTVRYRLARDVLASEPASYLLEKPVANELDEAERIQELCADSDTVVTVCHQKLYAEEVEALREWVTQGEIGTLRTMLATTRGGLTGQGTHLLHLLDSLAGASPTAVSAFAAGGESLDPDRNQWCPDHVEPRDTLVEVTYPDDVRAFVHLGPGAPAVPAQAETFWFEFRLDLVGTDGRGEFVLGDHATVIGTEGKHSIDARPFDQDAYMTRALYDDIARVLDGRLERHPADLDSAVRVHRTIDAVMRSAIEGRSISPGTAAPPVGRSTAERLKRRLLGRSPVIVSTLVYADRPRELVFEELAQLGVHEIDLWRFSEFAVHFDPQEESVDAVTCDLERFDLEVPVVSLFDEDQIKENLAFAAELGAQTAVTFGRTPTRPSTWDPDVLGTWLDCAAEHDMTIAFENHVGYMETIEEMEDTIAALDHPSARIALAPPHLHHAAGQDSINALARLGDRVEVIYLWDTHPRPDATGDEAWWKRAGDQIPGSGGVLDVERYLEAAIAHAPGAHWTFCIHGTQGWGRNEVRQAIGRGLRAIETNRPT